MNICKKSLQSCPRLPCFLCQWVELAVAACLLAFHWTSRPPRTPPPLKLADFRLAAAPRVRDLRGTPPLARRCCGLWILAPMLTCARRRRPEPAAADPSPPQPQDPHAAADKSPSPCAAADSPRRRDPELLALLLSKVTAVPSSSRRHGLELLASRTSTRPRDPELLPPPRIRAVMRRR